MTIDEFKRTELRVAKIVSAERIENSEKLLKLRVSMGSEERQIIAGIGKAHEPEALVGKEIVIVANLEPRILMGLESRGMLLAVRDENGSPVLLRPEREVEPGTEVG